MTINGKITAFMSLSMEFLVRLVIAAVWNAAMIGSGHESFTFGKWMDLFVIYALQFVFVPEQITTQISLIVLIFNPSYFDKKPN